MGAFFLFIHVINVVPFQQRSKFFRLRVAGQIAPQHLFNVEIVRQLETQRRVVNLLLFHLCDKVTGRQFVGISAIIRDAPPGHNTFQVQLFAEFFAGIIKPPTEPEITVIGMNEYFNTIKPVAFGIMGIESVAARNFFVGMIVAKVRVFHPNS